MSEQSVLLTRSEAAKYMGITPGTLAVWACEKRYPLPYIKVGRAVRYRQTDLDQWLTSRTVISMADELAITP